VSDRDPALPPPPVAPIRTNTLALVGFIGVFFMPVLGIVLGIMAQRQIERTREEGRGLARAAVIIGVLGTAFQVVFFIVWASLFFTAVSQIPR
jgi:hypothetical protein